VSAIDLLVIGGGVAGAVAAAVARSAGATVVLTRKAWGATALSSGAVDWIEPDPDAMSVSGDAAAAQEISLERLLRERPDHPIAILCQGERTRARGEAEGALEILASLLDGGPAALAGPLGLYASAAGDVRFADRVQAGMAAGELSRGAPGRIGVLALPELEGWRPRAVVEALLQARDRGLARGVADAVEVPGSLPGAPPSIRMPDAARWIEDHGLPRIERPAGALRAILVPPVFGYRRIVERLREGQELLGVPIAETLAASPSVPGWRLQTALDEALRDRGVEVLFAAASFRGDGLGFRVGHRDIDPRAVILATGKFLGGGLAREGRLRETVFGLPVLTGGRTAESAGVMSLTEASWRAHQPLFDAGIGVDARLRPQGARPGVFAAGGVLAGWSYPDRGCGLAVCAITGRLAADLAIVFLGARVESAR